MLDFAQLRAEIAAAIKIGLVNVSVDTLKVAALLADYDAARGRAKPVKRNDYPDDFEQAWAAYPPRAGSNKVTAFKAWSTRIKSGIEAGEILAGVRRYAAYVKAERTEERYVKQPATFFGPDEHFALPWKASRGTTALAEVNAAAKRRLFGGDDDCGAIHETR